MVSPERNAIGHLGERRGHCIRIQALSQALWIRSLNSNMMILMSKKVMMMMKIFSTVVMNFSER